MDGTAALESVEDKFEYIRSLKGIGNGLFKQKRFDAAIKIYASVLERTVPRFFKTLTLLKSDDAAVVPCVQCFSNAASGIALLRGCHVSYHAADQWGARSVRHRKGS